MKNFAQQMAFYSVYHENKINIWIHIIGVPIIALGLFMALNFVNFGFKIGPIHITLASIYFLFVIGYFYILNVTFALLGTILYGGIYFLANHLVFNALDAKTAIIVACITFFGAFALQFVGHGMFEKKRPALVDNLFQAFMSAPFFIIVDLAFEFGLKKNLQKDIADAIKANETLKEISSKF